MQQTTPIRFQPLDTINLLSTPRRNKNNVNKRIRKPPKKYTP